MRTPLASAARLAPGDRVVDLRLGPDDHGDVEITIDGTIAAGASEVPRPGSDDGMLSVGDDPLGIAPGSPPYSGVMTTFVVRTANETLSVTAKDLRAAALREQ
jgi:hypothetical protein